MGGPPGENPQPSMIEENPVTLVNLTPHPIRLFGPTKGAAEEPDDVIEPSGKVARVASVDLGTRRAAGAVYELVEYSQVHDLPQPAEGTWYIVSLVVALAEQLVRSDLLVPYVEVRNDQGTMVGCRFLQKVCSQ